MVINLWVKCKFREYLLLINKYYTNIDNYYMVSYGLHRLIKVKYEIMKGLIIWQEKHLGK